MADIRRDVADIQPTNYVNPGVKKASPLSLAAAVGSQAIDLDVQLAKERLANETEGLRTTYEVSSFAAADVQDQAEEKAKITPADQQQVNSLGNSMAANQSAVDQGVMSYDEYRVRGERMLRMAISKRPGLAQEFRAVAAQHLGVDVVGASVDVLASAERQMLQAAAAAKKDDKPTQDFKRARDQLDIIGVPNAHMTDEQVMVVYEQNRPAIVAMLQHEATKNVVTTEVGIQKGQQDLNRPKATADFVKSVMDSKLEFYKSFSQGWAAIKSGGMKPDDITTVINNGSVQLNGRISQLRMSMANGDVDKDIAEKEIQGLQEMGNMMTELASGKLDNTARQARIDSINLYMQNALMDNENVALMSAATKVFTPDIMLPFVQPGGAFNKVAMKALGDSLNNTGTPESKASYAGSTASALISTVLDRGGSRSNPEMVPQMVDTMVHSAAAFVEMDLTKYKADLMTGPQGYLTVLWNNRNSLSKSLSADDKEKLASAVAMANMQSYQALVVAFQNKYPMMKDKIRFDVDQTTGEFIHPTKTLSPVEQAAVNKYNKLFDGKKLIDFISTMTGGDAAQADAFFSSSFGAYKQVKNEKAARRKAEAKAQASSGDAWWENFGG